MKRLWLPVPEVANVVNFVSPACDGPTENTTICHVDLVSPVIPEVADVGPNKVEHNLQNVAPNPMDGSEEKKKLIEKRASSGLLHLKNHPDTVNYTTSSSHLKLMDLCNFAAMKLKSLPAQKEAREDDAAPTGNNKNSCNLATPANVGFAVLKTSVGKVGKDMYGNIIKTKSAEVTSKQTSVHKDLQRSNSWDFDAPKCDIMSFVEEQMERDENYKKTPAMLDIKHPIFELSEKGRYSECTLDGLSAEELQKLEEDAITRIAESKIQNQHAMNYRPIFASDLTMPRPQYQAPPRRAAARAAVLRSPYIECDVKKSFKCSQAICTVHDAVCKFGAARKTRAKKNQDFMSLHHLAQSVEPGGVLFNTTREIGLFAIKDIENYLEKGDHLDRSEMAMIPVLQKMDEKARVDSCCHYFLFVINIRDKIFEVLDSMRSTADKNLLDCCIKLMNAVKNLWAIHYPESKSKINDFELLDIDVPKQTNNYNCGFHMLLHAQHWNGRKVYKFSVEDIPNARKLLTYSWITHPENHVNWKPLLGLE
ncbi:hypothetical protein ACP4OV_026731 [Aristida adscensionis]